jgi:hypothetical protein
MHTTPRIPRQASLAYALLLVALGGVACSGPQPAPEPPARGDKGSRDPKLRAAFEHCLAEQGLTRPQGAPSSPPKEAGRPDRAKLDACLVGQGLARPGHGPGMLPSGPPPMPEDPRFRQALAACAAEQGLPPPPAPDAKPQAKPADGRRPDQDRLHACLEAKGVKPPPPAPPSPPLPPSADR